MSKFQTLRLANGKCEAVVCNFGARLLKLIVPDKNGEPVDVVLGFDSPAEYLDDFGTYFGATVGRVANRIGGARFELDGKEYKLFANDGANHLHGGERGFDKRFWKAVRMAENSVEFEYSSPDMEEGYPARLDVKVVYTLSDGELKLEYFARAGGDTLCALTNHSYFNLDGKGSVLEHELMIDADTLTVVDDALIPTGERAILSERKCLDFSSPRRIGEYIGGEDPLMRVANGGYDFSFNFRGGADASKPRAVAYSSESGIEMKVYTDLPAVQFYSGNFLNGFAGKGGQRYFKHAAFCLETQCDIADIRQRTLKKDEEYHTITRYVFGVR